MFLWAAPGVGHRLNNEMCEDEDEGAFCTNTSCLTVLNFGGFKKALQT